MEEMFFQAYPWGGWGAEDATLFHSGAVKARGKLCFVPWVRFNPVLLLTIAGNLLVSVHPASLLPGTPAGLRGPLPCPVSSVDKEGISDLL